MSGPPTNQFQTNNYHTDNDYNNDDDDANGTIFFLSLFCYFASSLMPTCSVALVLLLKPILRGYIVQLETVLYFIWVEGA